MSRNGLSPSTLARKERAAANKAAHAGAPPLPPEAAKLTPQQKLEVIDGQLAALVAGTDGLEQARILDIRGRVVDVQHRMEQKAAPVVTMTPEETEAAAVVFLEGRGAVVTWPGRAKEKR